MDYITNKTFAEIKVGDAASSSHVLTKKDIELFATVSGDVNPAHLDSVYAESGIFHKIVAHGMWTASLISALLGTKLPGPGTIYLNQTLKFVRPVVIGDNITTEIKVIKKFVKRPILILECKCTNQHGKDVLTGIAKVLAPTVKANIERTKLPTLIFKD
jgi:acyl dehydratase